MTEAQTTLLLGIFLGVPVGLVLGVNIGVKYFRQGINDGLKLAGILTELEANDSDGIPHG